MDKFPKTGDSLQKSTSIIDPAFKTLHVYTLYARILLQLNIEPVEKWATPTFLLVMDGRTKHLYSKQ
jgi:hypothetical protein